MKWLIALTIALWATAAGAQTIIPLAGAGQSAPGAAATGGGGGGYTGPGDVVASAAGWYSCSRAYSQAQALAAVKMCNIIRASDSHTCDVLTSGSSASGLPGNTANCSNGGDNGQSASAFCNATTCTVTELYDQTGNTNHLLQATGANQPALTFSCISTFNCITASIVSLGLHGTVTEIDNPRSCSLVYKITTEHDNARMFDDGDNSANGWFCYESSANNFSLYAGGAGTNVTATDNVLHAAQGAFAAGSGGASNVDGVDTTGQTTGVQTGLTVRGYMTDGSGNTHGIVGIIAEAGVWPITLSSTQRTNLCRNQQAFYGSGNFGAVC